MSIRLKLISILLLISIVPVVFLSVTGVRMASDSLRAEIGSKFENMAVEKALAIETILNSKIEETVILATHPIIIDALHKANGRYQGRTDDGILENILALDKEWISEKGKTQKAEDIKSTALSAFFRSYQNRNTEKYGEIFVTDIKGANVAMTKALSDYYQADESWWKESFAGGKGSVFIDDRGYDESVGAIVVGAVVPVRDGGKVLGILKINYKVTDVINVIASERLQYSENIAIAIARSSGTLVISLGDKRPNTITEPERRILNEIKGGWAPDLHNGKKTIMGYAPIDVPIFSRILPAGAERGVKGEKWHKAIWFTFLDIEQDFAFASINVMTKTYLIGGLMATLMVIVIALLLAANISRPIRQLHEGAQAIADGDLSQRLFPERKDEIGDLARAFNTMTGELQDMVALRRNILDSTAEAIFGIDLEGNCTFCNPSCIKMLGYEVEEDLLGRHMHDLIHHTRPDGSPYPVEECLIYKAIRDGEGTHDDSEVLWRKDGGGFPAEYWSHPMRREGKLVGSVVTFLDITERKAAEKALQKAHDELEERVEQRTADLNRSNKELENFAYVASHDLKAPLRGISNLSKWISDDLGDSVDDETKENLVLMHSRVERLEGLLDGLLRYSRVGRGDHKPEMVDSGELVFEISDYLSPPDGCEIEIAGGMPTFFTEKAPLEQVFLNLIGNAVKHRDKDELRITVSGKDAREFCSFEVRDNGPGIPEKFHERIFMMFQTLKPRDEMEASGMGLAMVKKLIDFNGGDILLESDPDERNTVFRFTWKKTVT